MALLSDAIGRGAIGSRPAAGSPGRLYFSTEPFSYRDNGSSWDDVSDPGAAGSVATDTIWDAAGDTVVGTGANTAARLAIGAAGGALSRVNGAVAWNSGTSFPAAATGDRYWRTDLGMEFFYDGTQWRSTHVETVSFPPTSAFTTFAGTANVGRLPMPYGGTYALWMIGFDWFFNAPSAMDGTNHWTAKINGADVDETDTQYGSTIDNNPTAAGKNSTLHGTGAVAIPTTVEQIKLRLDKIGSISLTYTTGTLSYQIIAT